MHNLPDNKRSESVATVDVNSSINPFIPLKDFYTEHKNDYLIYWFFPSALAASLESMSPEQFASLDTVCQAYSKGHYWLAALSYLYSLFGVDFSAIINKIDESQVIKDSSNHMENEQDTGINEEGNTRVSLSERNLSISPKNRQGIDTDAKDRSAQTQQNITPPTPLIKLLGSVKTSDLYNARQNLKKILNEIGLFKQITFVDEFDNNMVIFLIKKMKSLKERANDLKKPFVQDLIKFIVKKQDQYLAEIVFHYLKQGYPITHGLKDTLLKLSTENKTVQVVYGAMGYTESQIEAFKQDNNYPTLNIPAFALERTLDALLNPSQTKATEKKKSLSSTVVNTDGIEAYLTQRAYVADVYWNIRRTRPDLYQTLREEHLQREERLTSNSPELKTIIDYLKVNDYKKQSLSSLPFDPILLEALSALPLETRSQWAELINARQKNFEKLRLEELNDLLTSLIDNDKSCVFSSFTATEFDSLKAILNKEPGMEDVKELLARAISYKDLEMTLEQSIRVKEVLDGKSSSALSDKLKTKLIIFIESHEPNKASFTNRTSNTDILQKAVSTLGSVVRRVSMVQPTSTSSRSRNDSDAGTDNESMDSRSQQEKSEVEENDGHDGDYSDTQWGALLVELKLDKIPVMTLEEKKRTKIYSILTTVKNQIHMTSAIFNRLIRRDDSELGQMLILLKALEQHARVDQFVLNQVLIDFTHNKLIFINDVFRKMQFDKLKSTGKTKQDGDFWPNLSKFADRVLELSNQDNVKETINLLSKSKILTPTVLYALNLNLGLNNSSNILPILQALSKQSLLTEAWVLEVLSWSGNEVALYRPIFSTIKFSDDSFAFLTELRKVYDFSIMEKVAKNAEIVFAAGDGAKNLYRLDKDLFGKLLSKNESGFLKYFITLQGLAIDVLGHRDALLKLDSASLQDFVSKMQQLRTMGIKYQWYVEELLQENNRQSTIDALNGLPDQLKGYLIGLRPTHLKNWQLMDVANRDAFIACLPYLKSMQVPPLSLLANQTMNSQWSNRLSVFQTLEAQQFPPETWSSMLKLNENEFNRTLTYGPYLSRLKKSRLNVEMFFDAVIHHQDVASYVQNIESLYALFKDSEIDLSELDPAKIDNLILMDEHNRQAVKEAGPYLRKIGDSSFELLSDPNANTRWGQQLFAFKILEKIKISPKKWLDKQNDLLMYPEDVLRAGFESDKVGKETKIGDLRITLTLIQANLDVKTEAKNLETLLIDLDIDKSKREEILGLSAGKWVEMEQAILFLRLNDLLDTGTLLQYIEKLVNNPFVLNVLEQPIRQACIIKTGYDNATVTSYLKKLLKEDDMGVMTDIFSALLTILQKDRNDATSVMKILKEVESLSSEQQKDIVFCIKIIQNNPPLFNIRNIQSILYQTRSRGRIFADGNVCERGIKQPVTEEQFNELLVSGKMNSGSTFNGVADNLSKAASAASGAAKHMYSFLNQTKATPPASTTDSSTHRSDSSMNLGKGSKSDQ